MFFLGYFGGERIKYSQDTVRLRYISSFRRKNRFTNEELAHFLPEDKRKGFIEYNQLFFSLFLTCH